MATPPSLAYSVIMPQWLFYHTWVMPPSHAPSVVTPSTPSHTPPVATPIFNTVVPCLQPLQVPQLPASLSGLHQLLEARVSTFSRLCQLQGKLDLMIAQGEADAAQYTIIPATLDPTTG